MVLDQMMMTGGGEGECEQDAGVKALLAKHKKLTKGSLSRKHFPRQKLSKAQIVVEQMNVYRRNALLTDDPREAVNPEQHHRLTDNHANWLLVNLPILIARLKVHPDQQEASHPLALLRLILNFKSIVSRPAASDEQTVQIMSNTMALFLEFYRPTLLAILTHCNELAVFHATGATGQSGSAFLLATEAKLLAFAEEVFSVTESNCQHQTCLAEAVLLWWLAHNQEVLSGQMREDKQPDSATHNSTATLLRLLDYHVFCMFDQLRYIFYDIGITSLPEDERPREMKLTGAWRTAEGGDGYCDIVCQSTIPHVPCFHLVFANEDQQMLKKYPLLHIFLKGRPIKNQTRMIHNVTLPMMEADPWFREFMIHLVMVTLLGSYKAVGPCHRLSPTSRLRLYLIYDCVTSGARDWSFWKFLLFFNQKIITRATQQYIVYRLGRDPHLMKYCRTLFDVDAFSQLVHKTCDALVAVMHRHQRKWSAGDSFDRLRRAIAMAIKGACDKEFLRLNYVIPEKMFLNALRVRHSKTQTVINLTLVTEEQARYLRMLVERIPDDEPYPETYLFKHLLYLGSTSLAIRELMTLAVDIDAGVQCPKALLTYEHRHTFELACYFSMQWKRHTRHQTYNLPLHYAVHQADAIRSRFKKCLSLPPTEADPARFLPLDGCVLRICPVCDRVNSYFRDWETGRRQGDDTGYEASTTSVLDSLFREYDDSMPEEMKLQDVRLRGAGEGPPKPITEQLFCNGAMELDGQRCRKCPELSVFLLGKVLLYEKKLIMICPQPGCGVPSVINPWTSVYTSYGYSCVECTTSLNDISHFDKNARKQPERNKTTRARMRGSAKSKGQTSATSLTVGSRFETPPFCPVCEKNISKTSRYREIAVSKEDPEPLIICFKHGPPRDFERERAKVMETKVNPACVEAKKCTCADLKSTCTGTWNRASIIQMIRTVSAPEIRKMRAEARTLKWNTERAPTRKVRAKPSNKRA